MYTFYLRHILSRLLRNAFCRVLDRSSQQFRLVQTSHDLISNSNGPNKSQTVSKFSLGNLSYFQHTIDSHSVKFKYQILMLACVG